MEERRLMAADVNIGVVYYDPASGEDKIPNTFQVQFERRRGRHAADAPGDQHRQGRRRLANGDPFFNTAAGGPGVYGFHPFQVVSSDGMHVTSVTRASTAARRSI